jgi:hypothetical protein
VFPNGNRIHDRMVELFVPWLLQSCLLSFQALHSVICSAIFCRRQSQSLVRLICGSLQGVGLRAPHASFFDGLGKKQSDFARCRWVIGE